jgi:hypothetical protein
MYGYGKYTIIIIIIIIIKSWPLFRGIHFVKIIYKQYCDIITLVRHLEVEKVRLTIWRGLYHERNS